MACNVKIGKMTKTRKTLLIAFVFLAVVLVSVGSYAKLEHWDDLVRLSCLLLGTVFSIVALVIAMWRPKMR